MQIYYLMLNEKNALKVKRVAENFVATFANAAGHAGHVTVYMHILQCHVLKFIESYGDLLNYGCHGSELEHARYHKEELQVRDQPKPKNRALERTSTNMNALQTNIHHDADLPTLERKKRKTHAVDEDCYSYNCIMSQVGVSLKSRIVKILTMITSSSPPVMMQARLIYPPLQRPLGCQPAPRPCGFLRTSVCTYACVQQVCISVGDTALFRFPHLPLLPPCPLICKSPARP
jgi:hypothetical protein